MRSELTITIMSGPVTVAYRRTGGEWICTALQFDIVGTGATRDEAFDELRALFQTYLREVVDTEGPVKFFNPSDAEEWQRKDKGEYRVEAILAKVEEEADAPPRVVNDIAKLRPYRDRIKAFDLTPAGV